MAELKQYILTVETNNDELTNVEFLSMIKEEVQDKLLTDAVDLDISELSLTEY